ncbi:hypothetical protein AURDEDRAFT_165952 [Auricularia subglabra TFB-10046 SS5]|nr:hypothetical protein AURDEDRAFT_165952 [Auricularia subglabra TFB-10046 SS5]
MAANNDLLILQGATYQLANFYGDSATTAQTWLHEFEKTQGGGQTTTAAEKKYKARQFPKYLLGDALEWWDELTDAQQANWDTIVALFNVRWPKPKAVKQDHEERVARFRTKKLTREELDKLVRIPNGRPDDARWRITEFSEELAALAKKTNSAAADLILYTYEQVPKGVEKLMRAWRRKNKDADFADFCTALGDLEHSKIMTHQAEFDTLAAQQKALEEQEERTAKLQRELEQLRASVQRQSSSPPRGRGLFMRGGGLPPYASRESSPLRQPPLDPQATPFVPRRQQSPAPQPPTPSSPDRTLVPATPKSPPARQRLTVCMRCGEPLTDTHTGSLQCTNPPLPADEQARRMSEFRDRNRRFLTSTPARSPAAYPLSPGTPTPAPRLRDVYNLDTDWDGGQQFFGPQPVAEQFLDGDEEQMLAFIAAEEYGEGNEFEAGI